MAHYVTVMFEVPTDADYTSNDVREAVEARLDEIYPSDLAIPENVRVAVLDEGAHRTLTSAMEVGLEGLDFTGNFQTETWYTEAASESAWAALQHLTARP